MFDNSLVYFSKYGIFQRPETNVLVRAVAGWHVQQFAKIQSEYYFSSFFQMGKLANYKSIVFVVITTPVFKSYVRYFNLHSYTFFYWILHVLPCDSFKNRGWINLETLQKSLTVSRSLKATACKSDLIRLCSANLSSVSVVVLATSIADFLPFLASSEQNQ